MSFVVVGGGQAAGAACRTLRQEGYDGPLTVLAEEPAAPYERPPLSKEYLRGEAAAPRPVLPEAWWAEKGVDLRTGARVARVDAAERQVELESGERVAYERLLLCTGGRARRLAVPGADWPTVHYLRTAEDSRRLGEALREAKRAVLVGAGFIGLEVAASARKMGVEVVCVEMLDKPLRPIVGAVVSDFLAEEHRSHGVDLRLAERVVRLEGSAVVTDRGRHEGDLIVVGIGILPNVEVAEGTGVEIDDGLVTDEFCRTRVPEIFAAGDVARFWHPVLEEHVRFEHYANANGMGAAAARNMLGREAPYTDLPWFWTDQYDLNVQMVGHARLWDDVAVRGAVESRSFTVFYLADGVVRMALAVNRFKDLRAARGLIGKPVAAEALADDGVDLKGLA